METTQDITLKALSNLTTEQVGEVIAYAISEELISNEELGNIIRTGRLDDLDDETIGGMIAAALENEIISPADLLLMVK